MSIRRKNPDELRDELGITPGGGGAFTDLSDVPTSYTGEALKVVRVNAGETALEFATPVSSSGSTLQKGNGAGGFSATSLDEYSTANLSLGVSGVTAGTLRALGAEGSATDISLGILPKGTGGLLLGSAVYTHDSVLRGKLTTFTTQNSSTNSVYNGFIFNRSSSGTPANGIGLGIIFNVETTAINDEDGVILEAICTDVTGGSEDFDFTIRVMASGAGTAEGLRLISTKQLKLSGYTTTTSFTGTPVGLLQFDASGNILTMPLSSAYTPTNVSTDRSYDANATTLDELADIVGTLISDLQAAKILG